ncbi:hypothetical protein BDN71DRAFT_1512615 [Pleurotus eryngii]|uniref:Uncharacterized protein n=1 Tax=Pleurotus eryngii TaxID=5323 RepID=A0A9P5ZIX7_PLEER|nr:hypothetical protein BDN71DRAFT_1512615 [Pleurotus eryngii]
MELGFGMASNPRIRPSIYQTSSYTDSICSAEPVVPSARLLIGPITSGSTNRSRGAERLVEGGVPARLGVYEWTDKDKMGERDEYEDRDLQTCNSERAALVISPSSPFSPSYHLHLRTANGGTRIHSDLHDARPYTYEPSLSTPRQRIPIPRFPSPSSLPSTSPPARNRNHPHRSRPLVGHVDPIDQVEPMARFVDH